MALSSHSQPYAARGVVHKQSGWKITLTKAGPVLHRRWSMARVTEIDHENHRTLFQFSNKENPPPDSLLQQLVNHHLWWSIWTANKKTCCVCCQKVRYQDLKITVYSHTMAEATRVSVITHKACEHFLGERVDDSGHDTSDQEGVQRVHADDQTQTYPGASPRGRELLPN